MHRFGLDSTARASFAIYTTHDEIDYLADTLDPRAGVLHVTIRGSPPSPQTRRPAWWRRSAGCRGLALAMTGGGWGRGMHA